MKRMISACLRFEAPDLWLAVPAALFPVLVVEVTALMIAATEDDPEALVLLPGVGMILTVVLCCVLGVVYLCSNFPLLLQFSASRRGSLAGLCLHILRMTVLAEVIAAAATMALGAVNHGFFPRFAVGELWRGIPVFVWPVCAVLPVLLLNTLFSSLLFLPTILSTAGGWGWFDATPLRCPAGDLHAHLLVVLKSCIVLSSWGFGYFGIKHLPLTIVGPINATRPVMTLVGAMLIFGERLNGYQWVGVVLAIGSLFLLSRSSRREGVDFRHDVWIYCIAAAAVLGAASGLYDKFITRRLDPVFVQSWYTFYQFWMMSAAVLLIWWPRRRRTTPFHWSWAIPFISLFLSAADLCYLYALSDSEAMISVVSMIRRGSVVVSFGFGALLFRERNLRAKAIDLALILVGMVFLWIGSR